MQCGMFSGTPGLYLPDVISTAPVMTRISPDMPKVPWRAQSPQLRSTGIEKWDWEIPTAAQTLTIDVETVSVQGVGAQPGDPVGQLTQLLVQFFSVQPGALGVRTVGADGVHSCRCSILLHPRVVGTGG